MYAESEIPGSPFNAEIFDPSLVQVTPVDKALLGKEVVFEGKKKIWCKSPLRVSGRFQLAHLHRGSASDKDQ